MAGLLRTEPWRYLANVTLWVIIYLAPVVPGLLTAVLRRPHRDAPAGLDVPTLIALLLGYAVSSVANIFLAIWNDVHFRFRMASRLRINAQSRILELPGATAVPGSTGDAITRFREDVEQFEETLSWTVDVIGSILFSTVSLWILASIDAQLTLVVFAPLVVVVVLAERAGSMVERARRQAREATGEVTGAIGEIFGGIQAVKLAGAEDRVVGHLRRLNQERQKVMVRDRVLEEGLDALFWNTVNLGTGLVLLLAADRIGQPGELTVGDFALFVYFMGFITENVHVLGSLHRPVPADPGGDGTHARPLGGAPPQRLAEPVDLHLDDAEPAVVPPTNDGHNRLTLLETIGLSYRHPDTGRGVNGDRPDHPAGSFTVIAGRIGSGKTTLLRAMLGLVVPDAGEIRWNGRGSPTRACSWSRQGPPTPRRCRASLLDDAARQPRSRARSRRCRDRPALRTAVLDDDIADMPDGWRPRSDRLGFVSPGAKCSAPPRRGRCSVERTCSCSTTCHRHSTWRRSGPYGHGCSPTRAMSPVWWSHTGGRLCGRADQIVVLDDGAVVAVGGALDWLLATNDVMRAIWSADEASSGVEELAPVL